MLSLRNKVRPRNLLSTCVCFNTKYSPVLPSQDYVRVINRHLQCSTEGKKLEYDVVVVGGGIVGMATARELKNKHPNLKMCVLEKENKLATHQTGHNSGVIHAGIYYKPESLKARLCVKGLHLMYKYCDKKNIPYKKCGKLIVATNEVEKERLDDLIERGKKNNVPDMRVLEASEIKKIEPHCEGIRAIVSPHTGIIDYAVVTQHLGNDFVEGGGEIHLNFKVKDFKTNESESGKNKYPLEIVGDTQNIKASYAVVCAGLHSDRLAILTGCSEEPKIIPIRGEYLLLSPEKAKLVKGNIYPVPNPNYPFLGVHFTPRMDGSVWLGPNAVLSLKREGYRWSDFNIIDFFETITYSGFIRLAFVHARFGVEEVMKSIKLEKQILELKKFIPHVTECDVRRGPAGVRAQALDKKGNLVDDFVFDLNSKSEVGKRVLHCRNAPSPGATSSLAIAELIAERVNKEFSLSGK